MITCLNPKFIVNPSLPDLLCKYQNYYLNGKWCQATRRYNLLYKFNKKPFTQLLPLINKDNYEKNFVVDSDGLMYPIYLCVPCNHCVICKDKKVNSFVTRMVYESFCYHCKPLFVTLTYNNQWLPQDGVSVRDSQLFLKRLRINLQREGFFSPIRFALTAEYGRNTHRAHMHLVLFGIPTDDDYNFKRFQMVLEKSWPFGFVLSRHINPKDTRSYYYTTKYLRKDCEVPEGKNPAFFHSSVRGGGLGSPYLSKLKQEGKRITADFQVLNPFTNRPQPFKWSSYCLNKLYPTESRFLPLELRKSIRQYLLCYHTIATCEPNLLWLFETNYKKICNKFKDIFMAPYDYQPYLPLHPQPQDIYTHERIILKYMNKDYSNIHDNLKKRDKILSNLHFEQIDDAALVQRACQIQRKTNHLKNYEVF